MSKSIKQVSEKFKVASMQNDPRSIREVYEEVPLNDPEYYRSIGALLYGIRGSRMSDIRPFQEYLLENFERLGLDARDFLRTPYSLAPRKVIKNDLAAIYKEFKKARNTSRKDALNRIKKAFLPFQVRMVQGDNSWMIVNEVASVKVWLDADTLTYRAGFFMGNQGLAKKWSQLDLGPNLEEAHKIVVILDRLQEMQVEQPKRINSIHPDDVENSDV